MNRKYYILSTALLSLLAGDCLLSCQQDDFGEALPDRETLITQGRYLTARSVDAVAASEDPDKASWFEAGTPYRLLAFTKPYDASKPENEENTRSITPRFNKVAWEGTTSGGLRFINIAGEPDKWFGFSAIGKEDGGTDGLVSLDFYGFTYGKKVENHPSDYIALDDLSGETMPEKELALLTHTETVSDDGTVLNDLLRGELLNQNIITAGKDASTTQSILPFTHCFSKLRFLVVQQAEDDPDENGNPVPCFPNIQIEKIEVTRTYKTGAVYLQDGKVELMDVPISRPLQFRDTYKGAVTLQQVDMGEMIIFPSDGAALKEKADGYSVGLNITVKSKNKKDIEQFLANTNPEDKREVTGNDTDGWSGTVEKESITDNYTNKVLYFKQNTAYTLVLSFQKNAVRIITVIPQVEEWLPGEGTDADPWQVQALGQPQMFDNIVWSDRNLGADHYDPSGENFEKTIGYFYQSGRNIPYYTFNYKVSAIPDFGTKNTQNIADKVTKWQNTEYRFYPIVDSKILKMTGSTEWTMYTSSGNPQMIIPEKKPEENYYFDFLRGTDKGNSGLTKEQDMHWEEGQQNQPVTGAWVIPSSKDFMTIFPSTPHAGNITLRDGGNNSTPMDWGKGDYDLRIEGTNTLRVTVPYYTVGMAEPTHRTGNYIAAWKTLKKNEYDNEGTTHTDKYKNGGPASGDNLDYEPDGDPEDGYASVYVISGEEEDSESLTGNIKKQFKIQTWGTIYAIKRVYTFQAYRMRWRALIAKEGQQNPCLYIEICRYRCNADDHLNETNYRSYDWEHPAARIYFPVCGLGDWTGEYINFGTECQYATSDPIVDGKTSALQIKITGDNAANAYIAIVRNVVNRNFAKQIRPIGGYN